MTTPTTAVHNRSSNQQSTATATATTDNNNNNNNSYNREHRSGRMEDGGDKVI
jgi:hypothetical protein